MTLTPGDKREIDELIAQKLDIMSAFRDLPDADREAIARDLEGFLYGRAAALPSPKNEYTPRWTKDGADINLDSLGAQKGHAGPTLPRWIDLVGGSAYLDTNDPQILHFAAGGMGAICYDVLVDSCWTGADGAQTNFMGCSVFIYKTFGAGLNKATSLGFKNRAIVMAVCPGTYIEQVVNTPSDWGGGVTIIVEAVGWGWDTHTTSQAAPVILDGTTSYALDVFWNYPSGGLSPWYAGAQLMFRGIRFKADNTSQTIRIGNNAIPTALPPSLIFESCLGVGLLHSTTICDVFARKTSFTDVAITGQKGGSPCTYRWRDSTASSITLGSGAATDMQLGQSYEFSDCPGIGLVNLYVPGHTPVRVSNCGILPGSTFTMDYNYGGLIATDNLWHFDDVRVSKPTTAPAHVDYLKFVTAGPGSFTGDTHVKVHGSKFQAPDANSGTIVHYISFVNSGGMTNRFIDPIITDNDFPDSPNLTAAVVTETATLTNALVVDNTPANATVTVTTAGSSNIGGDAANEPYVVYNTPSAGLTNARQYFGTGTTPPGGLIRPEGAFFYDRTGNALYITSDGAGTWQAPQAMKVYTSLGESPNFPVSIL